MVDIQKDNYGMIFRCTINNSAGVAMDLSNATSISFELTHLTDASPTIIAAGLTTDGTDGRCDARIPSGTFDQEGAWKFQVHIIEALANWRTSVNLIDVKSNST